ncbi:hypothetical protein HPB48_005805 [Haemaphysalis longicornis]|uniref:Chitin-binding type-2 domain-containing protein n=1 Tax=Haemaphysalis longicornis TaxID=44386 RepID=A0A9J6GMV6_HAELO|nr:hypothetical protein HPB48_005805 [Haemaphysalis longicornis]
MVSVKVVVVAVMVVVVCSVVVQGKSKGAKDKGAFDFSSFLSPPVASPDCPAEVAKGGVVKVADPDDCGKYSLCTATFSTKVNCPPLQHFSKDANECLPQEVAGCDPAVAAPAEAEPAPAEEDVTDEAAAEAEA